MKPSADQLAVLQPLVKAPVSPSLAPPCYQLWAFVNGAWSMVTEWGDTPMETTITPWIKGQPFAADPWVIVRFQAGGGFQVLPDGGN